MPLGGYTKKKPIISGSNIFFQALDVLNTPQQAIFGAVKYGGLEGAEKGMREDVSFYDLLEGMDEGYAKTGLGLAGDIVLDPVNLIPGAALAKVGKVAKGASKAVSALTGADKALTAIRETPKVAKAMNFVNDALRSTVARRANLGPEGLMVQDLSDAAESVVRSKTQVIKNLAGEIKAKGYSQKVSDTLLERGRSPFMTSLDEEARLISNLPSIRDLSQRYGVSEDVANNLIIRRIERKTGSQGQLVDPEELLFKKGPAAATMPKAVRDIDDIARVVDEEPLKAIDNQTGSLWEMSMPNEAREAMADTAKEIRKYINSDLDWLATKGVSSPVAEQMLKDDSWERWAQLSKRTREMSNAQNAAVGVPVVKLADENLDYILHVSTQEFRNAVLDLGEKNGLSRKWSAAHASMLPRVFRNLDVDRLNALGKQGLLPGFEGKIFKQVVHDEPITLEVFRQMRDIKAQEGAKLYQRAYLLSEAQADRGAERFAVMATDPAKKAELIKGGWKPVDPMPGAPDEIKNAASGRYYIDSETGKRVQYDNLYQISQNILWHPDVANVLQRYQDFATSSFRNDQTPMGKFLDLWEGMTGAWKATGLSWRPDYHMRNMASNIYMAFMSLDNVSQVPALIKQADAVSQMMVRNVPRTSAAGTVLGGFIGVAAGAASGETTEERIRNAALGLAGGALTGRLATATRANPTFKVGGKEISSGEFMTLAENMGIMNSGQYSGELKELLEQSGKVVKKISDFKPLKAGRQFGEILEQHARATVFAHRLSLGDTITDAAVFTKKAMVDYGNMTPFERKVARRAIPFYAWMKNNGILTVSTLVNPGKWGRLQGLGDVISTVERDVEAPRMEDRIVPRFIQDRSGVRIREDEKGNPEYFLLGGWLPSADLVELAKPFTERDTLDKWDLVIQSLAPQIKAPIEYLSNQDLYFRQEIERFPGEMQKVFGMQIQKRYWQVMKSIIALNQAEDLINSIVPGSSDRTPKGVLDQIAQRFGGLRVYRVDEGRSLANYFFKQEKELGKTKALIRRAQRTGDKADLPTLLERYRKIASHQEDLE